MTFRRRINVFNNNSGGRGLFSIIQQRTACRQYRRGSCTGDQHRSPVRRARRKRTRLRFGFGFFVFFALIRRRFHFARHPVIFCRLLHGRFVSVFFLYFQYPFSTTKKLSVSTELLGRSLKNYRKLIIKHIVSPCVISKMWTHVELFCRSETPSFQISILYATRDLRDDP